MNSRYINIKSCFIGPKGENKKLFIDLLNRSIKHSLNARENDNCNKTYIDDEHFELDNHNVTCNIIEENVDNLCRYLSESLQFSSFKYNGHMVGDILIPSLIGSSSAMLYNQNILSNALSNKITFIEMAACYDICAMIGYSLDQISYDENDYKFESKSLDKEIDYIKKEVDIIKPFAHLTSGGSISNIESTWCSFFVKCIAIAIKNAIINNEFKDDKGILLNLKIKLSNGDIKSIDELSNWDLMNVNNDYIVNLPYRLSIDLNISFKIIMKKIKKYHISTIGIYNFCSFNNINVPVFLAPSSIHYSLSKAAIILGIGNDNVKSINVDQHARMDIDHLKQILNECYNNKIPVINVVSVLGTTQESAVDDLHEILSIRDYYRSQFNYTFDIHADGAFGSYFISMIRDNYPIINPPDQVIFNNNNELIEAKDSFDPSLICSEYLLKQLQSVKYADTVTVDPHKTGFVQYCCGAVCFRNSKYKDILVNSVDYLTGTALELTGSIGIEGSRSGNAATSLYLAHSIIRPSKIGYGYILKKCLLNAKLFYFKLLHLNDEYQNQYHISFITRAIPNDKYQIMKSKLIKPNGDLINIDEIESNYSLLNDLSNESADLTCLCFCFNFKINNKLNNNYQLYKLFNNSLIQKLNHLPQPNDKDLILSSTIFNQSYGPIFISNIINSIGLTISNDQQSSSSSSSSLLFPFIRVTIMNPFLSNSINGSYLNDIIKIIHKTVLNELNNFI